MGGWVNEVLVKNNNKQRIMGQNMANLGGQPEKRRKDKAQGTKGKIATKKAAQNTRRGNLYMENI